MNQDLESASSISTDAPLTLSEAVKAITATPPADEVETDQSDADEAQEADADEDQPTDEDGEVPGSAPGYIGEPGEGDQAEDEDRAPESEKGRYVAHDGRVRLPDGTEATVSELINGNLRNADATRKWQEAADLRRQAEAESASLKQHQQQLSEQRDYVASLIQSIIPEMPGPELLEKDSKEYWTQRAAAEQWQNHLAYLNEQKQRDEQARQAETQQQVKERLAREWTAALAKIPELSDPQRLEAFGKDTLKYGAAYGYTPEELSRIHHDHRQLVVFKKAMAWDKLQDRKASKPDARDKGRPPVMKGGNRLNPKAARARTANAAMERLNQTGSLRDGVAALIARTQSKG